MLARTRCAVLNALGKALTDPRLRGRIFDLNGHTDSDGSEKYNAELSMNRALAPNASRENKQLNRWVEIVVSAEAVAAPVEEKRKF